MSGGRATVRGRTGRETFNQYGDVQATHPKGRKLLRLCSIELKRGYSSASITDFLDKPNGASPWFDFLKQAKEEAALAGCPFFLLIVKRDRRDDVVVLPSKLFHLLRAQNPKAWGGNPAPCFMAYVLSDKRRVGIVAMPLELFLDTASPDDFRAVLKTILRN